MLKRLVKAALKRFGIVAFKRSSRVYVPEDDAYRIVASLVDTDEPEIIDGGAHLGDVPDNMGPLFGSARFHCFEPDPVLTEQLDRKYVADDKVSIVHAALGDAVGRASLNINVSRPTNSLLPISDTLQPDLQKLGTMVEQVEVDVLTIDDYCKQNGIDKIDVIKLDLQGYDYLALRGAIDTLRQVQVVLVEVLFREFYQGCHLFPDILDLLNDNGFSLYTLSGLHDGEGDEILWADAIFTRRNPAPASTT